MEVKTLSIIVYTGSPSAVHRHWAARLESLAPRERNAAMVMTPSRRLASLLARLPHTPPALAVDDWLTEMLPQNIMPLPSASWYILSQYMPKLPAPWHETPGLPLAVAELVKEGRSAGVAAISPEASGQLPWDRIWQWFDEKLNRGGADALRMYDYALKTGKVPAKSGGFVFVYGFSDVTAPFIELMRQWGEKGPVEAWFFTNTVDAGTLRRWRARQVSLPEPQGAGETLGIRSALEGLDSLDVLARWVAPQIHDHGWVAVSPDERDARRLHRALARCGLPVDVERSTEEALWPLFLETSRGHSGAAVQRHWHQAVRGRVSVDWARQWWERAMQAPSWAILGRLVEEARIAHQVEWPHLSRWAQDIQIWDAWFPPQPESTAQVLPQIPAVSPEQPPSSLLPVLPLHEAAWIPNAQVLFMAHGRSTRSPRTSPFDQDGAIRPWVRRARGYAMDAVILQQMLNDAGLKRWATADVEDVEAAGWEDAAPSEAPPVDASDLDRLQGWYRQWRESPSYSAYTGDLTPETASALMPHRLSPSALEDFGKCPLSFLLGRLLRISPVDDEPREVDAAMAGQWAHRALEVMVEERRILTPEAVQAAVETAVRDLPAPPSVARFFIRYQVDRLSAELYEALLRDGWAPGQAADVEMNLTWERIWPMAGRVDRVDQMPGGGLRLIDYKTGHLANPAKPSPGNLQLLLYQDALYHRYRTPVTAELYGVSQRAQYGRRQVTQAEADALRSQVDEILAGIKERMDQGQFRPVPDPRSDACRMCAFKPVCPARVTEYAGVKARQDPDYQSLWMGEGTEDNADAD